MLSWGRRQHSVWSNCEGETVSEGLQWHDWGSGRYAGLIPAKKQAVQRYKRRKLLWMLFHMSILSCGMCGPVGKLLCLYWFSLSLSVSLPLLLSGALSSFGMCFFIYFYFLFFINLSGRHTSPRVLQLPDNTKEDWVDISVLGFCFVLLIFLRSPTIQFSDFFGSFKVRLIS